MVWFPNTKRPFGLPDGVALAVEILGAQPALQLAADKRLVSIAKMVAAVQKESANEE